jgi:hypothetical protein
MRLTRCLAILVAVGAVLVAPATAASAPLEPASGSFVEGPVENERFLGVIGGAEVYALERDVTFSGTYEGAARAHQTIAIREDGTAVFHIRIDFSGTACGEPASLTFQVAGSGSLVEGHLSGHYAVLDGRRVRGGGSFVGVPNTGGDYTGKALCD